MILAVEDAKARLHAVFADGVEHLQALGKRAAVVLVRVQEERGRRDAVGVLERRLRPDLLKAVPGAAAHLVLGEVPADVGGVVEAGPVRDAPLAGRALEAPRVAYYPVGHEAAVAAAHLGQTVGVDVGVALASMYEKSVSRLASTTIKVSL